MSQANVALGLVANRNFRPVASKHHSDFKVFDNNTGDSWNRIFKLRFPYWRRAKNTQRSQLSNNLGPVINCAALPTQRPVAWVDGKFIYN
jgi:hypothetical protein